MASKVIGTILSNFASDIRRLDDLEAMGEFVGNSLTPFWNHE
jgi:hypothetical protein